MTTIITRYFKSADDARTAKFELAYRNRVSLGIISLYDTAAGLADTLIAQNVDPKAAKAYEKHVAKEGAVLVVHAGFRPLGVAKTTRRVTAACGAETLSDLTEEVRIKAPRKSEIAKILKGHPKFLTAHRDPDQTSYHMADWPLPLISRRRPFAKSIFGLHARMANFPIPLISRRKPYTGSILQPHARMADFLLPLLSNRKPYTESAIEPHGRMADRILPLLSDRKPYTKTVIGRHTRMANWPFPHLINGKTGTNALVPGAPRMADFPIPLLSDRKPYTGSIFARHARMANFPIPLISKRTPYSEFAFPRHARMANFPIPLIVKGPDEVNPPPKASGFSISKEFGIPTLIRR